MASTNIISFCRSSFFKNEKMQHITVYTFNKGGPSMSLSFVGKNAYLTFIWLHLLNLQWAFIIYDVIYFQIICLDRDCSSWILTITQYFTSSPMSVLYIFYIYFVYERFGIISDDSAGISPIIQLRIPYVIWLLELVVLL